MVTISHMAKKSITNCKDKEIEIFIKDQIISPLINNTFIEGDKRLLSPYSFIDLEDYKNKMSGEALLEQREFLKDCKGERLIERLIDCGIF